MDTIGETVGWRPRVAGLLAWVGWRRELDELAAVVGGDEQAHHEQR